MERIERTNQIDEIMESINFYKIRIAMIALDWKWRESVPSVEQLRARSRELLWGLQEDSAALSSGGFCAYWIQPGQLGLRFVVDEYEPEVE